MVETLLEEFKLVVTAKYDIEQRHKSTKSHLRLLGKVRTLMQKSAVWKLNRIVLSKYTVAQCEPQKGEQICSYAETPFLKSR